MSTIGAGVGDTSFGKLCASLRSEQHETLRVAQSYLANCGPVTSLGFVLRMQPRFIERLKSLPPGDFEMLDVVRQSLGSLGDDPQNSPLAAMRAAWENINGQSGCWSSFMVLDAIHSCIIRGPSSLLRQLLLCDVVQGEASQVSSVILPHSVMVPMDPFAVFHRDQAILRESIETMNRMQRSHFPTNIEESEFVSAASFFRKLLSSFGFGDKPSSVERMLRECVPHETYLNNLGIGDIAALGNGLNQKVCILDTGADESHPMLNEKIAYFDRFDGSAQFKEAYASADNACHGSKVASIICGESVPLSEVGITTRFVQELGIDFGHLGLSGTETIGPGIASGGKLFVGGILSGKPFEEHCTFLGLMAGLNWAAANYRNGYCCVNASLEIADPEACEDSQLRQISNVCGAIQSFGIPVIVAAGNNGIRSKAIAPNAVVVGAAERSGEPLETNGPDANILAPGKNLLCAQPELSLLGNHLVSTYSGSSFATAIMSSCVAILCGYDPSLTGLRAVEILRKTTINGMINLDRARAYLES